MCDPEAFRPIVLLVEDEPLVRILSSDVLTEAGFRVLEAANADEALTILASALPVEVMVTDVDMPPGLNGFELAREVAALFPEIGILVYSGRRWPEAGDLPAGAAFFEKPVPNDVLVAQVKALSDRVRQKAAKADDIRVEVSENVIPLRRDAS